ncbi:MAG: anion permease, partial [Polyangiaceae bacterium]|nr:anion permease [Polyangiaceae bacterium]
MVGQLIKKEAKSDESRNYRNLVLFFFLSLGGGWLASWGGLPPAAAKTLGVTIFCALGWIFQPAPLAVISLTPLFALPFLGVLNHRDAAAAYGHTLIWLLFAGFLLSRGIEASGTHRRFAFGLIHLLGGEKATPRRLLLGFMLTSYLASMWISNTATLLILLPIILAACSEARTRVPCLVGSAWAASIGGMASPIGTPPNLLFMGTLDETFGQEWSFLDWSAKALPISLLLLPPAYWIIARSLENRSIPQVAQPSTWTSPEIRALIIFGITALLWITRRSPHGGWSKLLELNTPGDASTAALGAFFMMVIPRSRHDRKPLLSWEAARKLPWGVLLLFG